MDLTDLASVVTNYGEQWYDVPGGKVTLTHIKSCVGRSSQKFVRLRLEFTAATKNSALPVVAVVLGGGEDLVVDVETRRPGRWWWDTTCFWWCCPQWGFCAITSASVMASGSSCRLLKRGDLQLPGVDILVKRLNKQPKRNNSKNEQPEIY